MHQKCFFTAQPPKYRFFPPCRTQNKSKSQLAYTRTTVKSICMYDTGIQRAADKQDQQTLGAPKPHPTAPRKSRKSYEDVGSKATARRDSPENCSSIFPLGIIQTIAERTTRTSSAAASEWARPRIKLPSLLPVCATVGLAFSRAASNIVAQALLPPRTVG